MAAKENQGLQIAVMIFFLLVVILAVTTYVFFKSGDDQWRRVVAMESTVAETRSALNSIQTELNVFKEYMGFSPEDTKETVDAKFTEDMQKFEPGYDGERSYRALLERLHNDKLILAERELANKKRWFDDLEPRVAEAQKGYDEKKATFDTTMDTVSKDLASEREKFNEERTRVNQNADALVKQLEAKRNEITDLVAKNSKDVGKFHTQIQRQEQLIAQLRKRAEHDQVVGAEQPDGRITWVNQRANIVWINLGQADGLRRQTTFAVYPVDNSGGVITDKKGSIEITRIIDEHMAEGRIVDDSISDPILPGDNIHSPVWRRGHRDGFALAGGMDINDDGRSDREQVRDMIVANGGVVDVELQDDGRLVGKLQPTTRFLVLGTPPNPTGTDTTLLDNYSTLLTQAQQLGIETVPIQKFVNQMGYSAADRTVYLGRGANPEDHRARGEGVQRKSTGATSEVFQERQRPRSAY